MAALATALSIVCARATYARVVTLSTIYESTCDRMSRHGQLTLISVSSSRGTMIFAWVLQVLTGSLFLFAGVSKLLGVAEMVNFFAQVGFGQWLRYFLGVLEVGSAAALFFPRQAFYGVDGAFRGVGRTYIHSHGRAASPCYVSSVSPCGHSPDRFPPPAFSYDMSAPCHA